MAYKLMKVIILRGDYDKQDIMDKLDAYLAFSRITLEEYNELAALARINYLADNLQITEEQRAELTTLAKQNGQNEILSVNERLDMLEECIIEIAQIVYA